MFEIIVIAVIALVLFFLSKNKKNKKRDSLTLLPMRDFIAICNESNSIEARLMCSSLVFQAVHVLKNAFGVAQISAFELQKLDYNPNVFVKDLIKIISEDSEDEELKKLVKINVKEEFETQQSRVFLAHAMFHIIINYGGLDCGLYQLAQQSQVTFRDS